MVTSADPRCPKVLYVDDQPGNLTVFRVNFRQMADIQTVSSGQEALELLAVEEFPIVISDQRMDGMNGAELLAKVRQMYPDSIRILLTAHSDFDSIVSAVNEGQIARFVRKPWDRDEMAALLQESHQIYWKNKENQALTQIFVQQARLASVGQIAAALAPALSEAAHKLGAVDQLPQLGLPPGAEREIEQVREGAQSVRHVAETLQAQAALLAEDKSAS